MKNLIKLTSLLSLASVLFLFSSCNDDEIVTPPSTNEVVASFQYEVSADNWAEVSFSNFSQNADSYEWDFGDGNMSTEESPTHTYAESGAYTVSLTATGADGFATRSETVMVTDPNQAAGFLAGTDGKTWHLSRTEIALGIGPAIGDISWWSFGGVTPLGDRPCILDDSYTFMPDGTFQFESNNTIFVDADANGGWLGDTEGCYDESEAGVFTSTTTGEDVSAYANGGTYGYDYDTAENTITINGDGAYIGLASKTENGDMVTPVSSKKYTIFHTGEGDIADTLNIAIVALDGSFAWNFYLLSYHNPADLPDIPSSMPVASFSYFKTGNTVDFTNTSNSATSYMWDFGDGNVSMDENPTHTYAGDGDYTVTLTASDDMGQSDEATDVVSISSAVFTAADLSSATGKVWKLDGEGSYFVGPCPGCSDWWGGLDAAGVVERACQLDDEFIFFDDGTFQFDSKGQVWVEDFLGGAFECVDDGALAAPFDVFASATHGFVASDTEITVNGAGAYIGFNKAYNGAELPNDGSGTPASSITYQVIDYSNNAGVERLTITVDYSENQDNTANWSMRLISE